MSNSTQLTELQGQVLALLAKYPGISIDQVSWRLGYRKSRSYLTVANLIYALAEKGLVLERWPDYSVHPIAHLNRHTELVCVDRD